MAWPQGRASRRLTGIDCAVGPGISHSSQLLPATAPQGSPSLGPLYQFLGVGLSLNHQAKKKEKDMY